jgi:hypothetical protein
MKRILILEKKNLFFISEIPDVLNYTKFYSYNEGVLGFIKNNNTIEDYTPVHLSDISHMTELIFKNNKIFGKIKILETSDGIALRELINHFDFNFHLNYIKLESKLISVDIII